MQCNIVTDGVMHVALERDGQHAAAWGAGGGANHTCEQATACCFAKRHAVRGRSRNGQRAMAYQPMTSWLATHLSKWPMNLLSFSTLPLLRSPSAPQTHLSSTTYTASGIGGKRLN